MSEKHSFSRRDFLKTAGAAGAASVLNPFGSVVMAEEKPTQNINVSTRPFGKTGVNVSVLSLGTMFDTGSNQLLLRQAIQKGVTYWDTADCYENGKSEEGIGKYFGKYPEDRKKVFLVSKSCDYTPDGMSKLLQRSFERMKTDYVDLYFLHGISSVKDIYEGTKEWAEKAKKDKKIRFFGFSTHKNMEDCLLDAAKLGWIDGIMMTYNYRVMDSDKMKQAVEACQKAGIGLTAMKTQGKSPGLDFLKSDPETAKKLMERLLQKGFTEHQAKIKAVWENNAYISCVCSQMPNMTILMANTAAALDKTKLSSADMNLLKAYAKETTSDYCTGCSHLCESGLDCPVPVSDVMRYLMYSRAYGDHRLAVNMFREIPPEIREQMASLDYSVIEQRCPRKMAIGQLMKEAAAELA